MKIIDCKRNSLLTYVMLLTSVLLFSIPAKSTTINIAVSSNQFTPNNVSANIGDTLRWTWTSGNHNTTCNGTSGSVLPPGATPWAAPINSSTLTYNYVIAVSGTYNYVCTFHPPGMVGTISASGSGGLNTYLDENFNYPVGDSLGAHGWVSFSGGAINRLTVTSPGLVYPGYPLSGIGNATTLNISGQDSYKDFSSADSSGSYYASCMINVQSAQLGEYFIAFLPNNSTTFYSGRLSARSNGTGYQLGITKGSSSDTTMAGIWTPATYVFNTTYLAVLKYTFVTGGTADDNVSLFVLSSGIPAIEPTPTVGPLTFPSGDASNLGRIALRQGTATRSPALILDGIRIAKSWNNILTSINNNHVSTIAEDFSLGQNFPNPFNPTTTIKFTIPERGFVNLTVFNSLGKEVSNLVNENLEAGTFSSNFNGIELSSGVYFYKLTYTNQNGSNFVDTKRLLLVK